MARQWYILQDNKKYGPYSEEHMHSFVGEGRVKRNTLVWCKGMKGWARATDVEPFKSHFTGLQARPAERLASPAEPTVTPARRGGGRKATGALVVVIIVAGLGIWWIYPQLSGQPQSGQPTQSETQPPAGVSFEADGVLYTNRSDGGVYDGDTIYVSLTRINSDIQEEISDPRWSLYAPIRLARINAPEISPPQSGATETRDFLKQLLASGGNKVYLDLDNDARSQVNNKQFYDLDENRLVAVVWVYIDNKPINANAEVLIWGQANYPSHNWTGYAWITSEFNEQEWLVSDYAYVR